MACNHELLFGKQAKYVPEVRKRKLWLEIQEKVNAVGVIPRTIDEIKKRWYDMRLRAKEKLAERLKEANKTGGTANVDQPTPHEELIESTIQHDSSHHRVAEDETRRDRGVTINGSISLQHPLRVSWLQTLTSYEAQRASLPHTPSTEPKGGSLWAAERVQHKAQLQRRAEQLEKMKITTLSMSQMKPTLTPSIYDSWVLQQLTTLEYEDYNDVIFGEENPPPSIGQNQTVHLFSMLLNSISFCLGVTGNGLVIWITGFKMKRTVNTVWFLNLAIADFVFTFFLPLSITYIALGFHWPFGTFACKLSSTVLFLNMFASVFFLSVISVDRCVAVTKPVWSRNHRTPRLASLVACVAWVSALVVSLPYFFFRTTGPAEPNGTIIQCYNNYGLTDNSNSHIQRVQGQQTHQRVILARFLLGFLFPFSIIVICYTIIALRIHRNRMKASSKPFKIIMAVIMCFFLCWLPYHIFSFLELYANFNTGVDNRVRIIGVPIVSSLSYFNSCINPILYVFMGHDFKEKLCMSILTVFQNAFTENSLEENPDGATKSKSTTLGKSTNLQTSTFSGGASQEDSVV
ncbi:chemerin-like receptor 1 [Lissotriton helveticus]